MFILSQPIVGSENNKQNGVIITEQDTVISEVINNTSTSYFSLRVIIAGIIVIIMGFYIFQRYQKMTMVYNIDKSMIEDDEIGDTNFWDNVFNSISEQPDAKKTYDQLIRRCHPDRFPDDNKKIIIATELTAELGKHKLDLAELDKLAIRIKKELG